jgi:hypothetical protein
LRYAVLNGCKNALRATFWGGILDLGVVEEAEDVYLRALIESRIEAKGKQGKSE